MITENGKLVKRVAKQMGLKVEGIQKNRGYFFITKGKKTILLHNKFYINRNPIYSATTTRHKDITYFLLEKDGVNTPRSVFFFPKATTQNSIVVGLRKLKYPIIIKKIDGSNSQDIFPFITSKDEARKIISASIKANEPIMAQEMVFGNEYRLLLLDDKIIGALAMIPPMVTGDGKNTIKDLIEKKQRNLKRKTPLDKTLKLLLSEQGYKLESVPEKGTAINISRFSTVAAGGKTVDVTKQVNPGFDLVAKKAAVAVGKYLVGIDMICDDITKSPKNQNWNILEVNGKPDLSIHYQKDHDSNHNIIEKIIKFIFTLQP